MVSSALKTTINNVKDNQNDRKKNFEWEDKEMEISDLCCVQNQSSVDTKPIRSENRFGVACIRKM